ncbi:alpha-mannosidase [Candidatus Leptofilum sp.]|uniref:alpha-mannosidase n=1 Tax=Candidatus Leptofilum sp. TaxID=3241576 RepID=UPI003B5AA044
MRHQQRFTQQKISERLKLIAPLVYRQRVVLRPFRYHPLLNTDIPSSIRPDFDDSDWPIIEPGSYWGEWQTNFVMRSQFQIPDAWRGLPVALFLPLGDAGEFCHPEVLVYVGGRPFAACDRFHQEILLDAAWADGQPHALVLHGWTGRGVDKLEKLLMRPCLLVQIDQPTRDFVALVRVTLEVVTQLEETNPARGYLLNGLDASFKTLQTQEPWGEVFYASLPKATAVLRQHIAQAGPPLDVTVTAAGHAHIDVAWLWDLAQTRRKAGRTFHTVLRLMAQFPDYHFTQSQPQLYDYVRQDYPELFAKIKEAVGNGRWEPIGGMWVEADCNLSGGESLARQFLLGRRFFAKHFGEGVESPVLWLPDVFGYAWNLPQLIKQAGLDYFFTIKIGWSQYDRMPYDTFWWQGLDGSKILTHFSPVKRPDQRTGDYNAQATPKELLEGWRHFQQKETSRHLLMAYGYGDGGGGPTREMQENLDLLTNFPAVPKARRGKVIDFFRQMEQEVEGKLPTWKGELYLEYHRGTYTTQARNKKANRQSEFLLHDAEFLAAYASVVGNQFTEYCYPREALNRAWELVCLNQFHDIIPGSSINKVYVDALADYAEVRQLGEQVRDEALAHLARAMGCDLLVVNPTSFERDDLPFWADGLAEKLPSELVYQQVAGGLLLDVGGVRPYSLTPISQLKSNQVGSLSVSPTHLENDFLRVELNAAGDITRIYDKQNQRELLPAGAIANQWQAFEDRPMYWDAWDIDIYYDDKMWLAEAATAVTVVETGPLRATIQIERQILHSRYVQRISLSHHSPRLDFDTWIDWRERHTLLKVAFPLDVLSPTATYEIQWGNVERPTHRNTSWDWARFETCAQKWVDLSEGGYGVSLLNDCKYGHDIQDKTPDGGQIRLTLLRSPTDPDPEADQGEHIFRYSLLPHAGRWGEETIRQAYALNDPLLVYAAETGGAQQPIALDSLVAVDAPNVVIETVKLAEESDGLIVRLYECRRQRGEVMLTFGVDVTAVAITNLLEEVETELVVDGSTVTLPIKPYQIVTLRVAM